MKQKMALVMPTKNPTKLQYAIHKLIKKLWYIITGYTYFDVYYGTQQHIQFGRGVAIAPGVKIVASNPAIYDIWARTTPKKTVIGDYCYIGSNSVILPGVILGQHTIVSAGSVVNKSFSKGYCIIGGVPAKILKILDKNQCAEELSPSYYLYEKNKGIKNYKLGDNI